MSNNNDQPTWDQIIYQAGNTPPGYGGVATARAAQKVTVEIENLRAAIGVLSTNISSQTTNLNRGISGSVQRIIEQSTTFENQLQELNANIRDFNASTAIVSRKANRLILWYVVLTSIIAIATVLNLLK